MIKIQIISTNNNGLMNRRSLWLSNVYIVSALTLDTSHVQIHESWMMERKKNSSSSYGAHNVWHKHCNHSSIHPTECRDRDEQCNWGFNALTLVIRIKMRRKKKSIVVRAYRAAYWAVCNIIVKTPGNFERCQESRNRVRLGSLLACGWSTVKYAMYLYMQQFLSIVCNTQTRHIFFFFYFSDIQRAKTS